MDPFLYDIVVRPVSQVVNGRHGSHAKERARDSEALCQTFNGKLIGLVAVKKEKGLRAGGKLLSQTHPTENKRCEYAIAVSGKVYALYDAPSKKPEDAVCQVGSGFKVSPSAFVTANHVCQQQYTEEKKDKVTGAVISTTVYNLKAIYVTFESETDDINPDIIHELEFCFPMEVLPPPTYPTPPIEYTHNGVLWDPQNDFAFLRLLPCQNQQEFLEVPFSTPTAALPALDDECFVVGYPGDLTEQEFTEDYPALSFKDVKRTFVSFLKKTASFGRAGKYEGHLQYHTAATLPGVSGGLYFHFSQGSQESPQLFSGIHVGGSSQLQRNFVIPAANRNFALAYFTAITATPDDIQALRAGLLREYFEHHRGTLPDQVCDLLTTLLFPSLKRKRNDDE